MRKGHRSLLYDHENLNEPLGAVPGPVAFRDRIDATNADFGWRTGEHSDGWIVEGTPQSDPDDRQWFPKVFGWWQNVVGVNAHLGVE